MNRIISIPAFAALCFVTITTLTGCSSTPVEPSSRPTTSEIPARSYVERLSSDGLFAFGKSGIDNFNAEGRASLDALAAKLTDGRPVEIVHVIGHSDRIGNAAANVTLSNKRANAVRQYLVEHGVPADRITAVGRGSVESVVECTVEKGQALIDCLAPNRRVEIRVNFAD